MLTKLQYLYNFYRDFAFRVTLAVIHHNTSL